MIRPTLIYKTQRQVNIPDADAAFAFGLSAILGDGSLKRTEQRLCIDQSLEEYTKWKKELGVQLGVVSPNSTIFKMTRTVREIKTGQKTQTNSWRFYTRSLFSQWHEPFYVYKSLGDPTYQPQDKPKRRKRFPPELVEWFNHTLGLALFYMDDGGVQSNQAYFATGEVPFNEVLILKKALEVNFSLQTTTRYSSGKAVGLLVRRKDCGKFISLIEPYVKEVPCMKYKLNISP